MCYELRNIWDGFYVVALKSCDTECPSDNSVQLYSPVTSTGQTAQTIDDTCFLNTFQQFVKVCTSAVVFKWGWVKMYTIWDTKLQSQRYAQLHADFRQLKCKAYKLLMPFVTVLLIIKFFSNCFSFQLIYANNEDSKVKKIIIMITKWIICYCSRLLDW